MQTLEDIVARTAGGQQRWAGVGVVPSARENTDTEVESRRKWAAIYRLFDASGESQQDEVFAAVQMYFLANGCSPKGKYRKPIVTAGGLASTSGDVVKIIGKLDGDIRQFLRGRLEDSYNFLKYNRAVREDVELTTKAQNVGVSQDYCWLLADWLGSNCPFFVGDEADVYNQLRSSKIAAARAKALAAIDAVDKVKEMAPEAKMTAQAYEGRESSGLF